MIFGLVFMGRLGMKTERTLEIEDEALNSALSVIHRTSFRGFSIERNQT
jgi:hypothetical protein